MRQLKTLTKKQSRSIEEYGYVSAKDQYMPHISITGMNDMDKAKTVVAKLPTISTQFEVNFIAVAPFAQYGTCPQPITEYRLGT